MNKIIAAFDGLKFSESTSKYAIELARQNNTHLVGVFLDDMTYTSYKIYELLKTEGVAEDKLKILDDKDQQTRKKAALHFDNSCRKAGIEHSIHHDRHIALRELMHESIYADLLVIDAKETFTHYNQKLPTRFVREVLGNVQCPVFLAPPRHRPIDKIILLYDGEPNSVYAVKMFCYLLPTLTALPAEVISVKEMSKDLHLPDNELMKEFMKRHFPQAKYTVLKGIAEEEIVNRIKEQKGNALIVLGAYRRSEVSRWFRASMADRLMKEVKMPLFIAHNK
ncbi:MAG: universal stress protein [Terrimonas sp.]|nr:universal stress protein [Terrimonas sp.]